MSAMTTGGGVASEAEASEAEAATAALKPAESSMGDSSPALMDKRSPERPPPPAATVTTRDREEALASCASVARAALDRLCSCAKRRGRPACHCPTRDDGAFDRSVGRTTTNNKTKIERATKAATVRIFSFPSSTRSFFLRYILPTKRENRAGICLFRVFGKDPRRSQDRIVSATSCAFFFLYFLQIHLESPRSFLDFFGSKKNRVKKCHKFFASHFLYHLRRFATCSSRPRKQIPHASLCTPERSRQCAKGENDHALPACAVARFAPCLPWYRSCKQSSCLAVHSRLQQQ